MLNVIRVPVGALKLIVGAVPRQLRGFVIGLFQTRETWTRICVKQNVRLLNGVVITPQIAGTSCPTERIHRFLADVQ